jgi:hypothetical protein
VICGEPNGIVVFINAWGLRDQEFHTILLSQITTRSENILSIRVKRKIYRRTNDCKWAWAEWEKESVLFLRNRLNFKWNNRCLMLYRIWECRYVTWCTTQMCIWEYRNNSNNWRSIIMKCFGPVVLYSKAAWPLRGVAFSWASVFFRRRGDVSRWIRFIFCHLLNSNYVVQVRDLPTESSNQCVSDLNVCSNDWCVKPIWNIHSLSTSTEYCSTQTKHLWATTTVIQTIDLLICWWVHYHLSHAASLHILFIYLLFIKEATHSNHLLIGHSS